MGKYRWIYDPCIAHILLFRYPSSTIRSDSYQNHALYTMFDGGLPAHPHFRSCQLLAIKHAFPLLFISHLSFSLSPIHLSYNFFCYMLDNLILISSAECQPEINWPANKKFCKRSLLAPSDNSIILRLWSAAEYQSFNFWSMKLYRAIKL